MFKFIKDKINNTEKKTLIVFGLFLILYLIVIKGEVGNVGSPDEFNQYLKDDKLAQVLGKPISSDRMLSQYVGMLSIAEYGQIDIPEELIAYSGRDIGFTKDERVFSWFPVGLQIIATPFYWVGKIFNMSLLFSHIPIVLIGFINLILIYLISIKIFKLPKRIGYISAFIYGFSSVALVYSVAFISHQISTFLLLICFYLAYLFFKQDKLRNKILILSAIWFLWASSSFFDYPNWVIISPVFIYIFFKIIKSNSVKKNMIIFFSTSVIGLSALFGQGYYNHVVYGNWSQMSNTLPQYSWRVAGSLEEKNENYKSIKERKNNVFNILSIKKLKEGLNVLLVSSERGLFVFTPVFIISLLGYFYFLRNRNSEKIFLLYAPIFTILLYGLFHDPWGGWSFGSRYLLPVMAIMSISVGILYDKIKNIYFRGLIICLAIFSLVQALAGVLSTTALAPGVKMMNYGVRNYLFLKGNISGNFWYEMFFYSFWPLISFSVIILTIFIGVFVYILKD